MTNPYLIHAWCLRPFITCIEVEARSPEQAIALARNEQDKLLDAAEECARDYPWDEFAAYDESGNELLHHVDAERCVRNAAPDLLESLTSLVDAAECLDAAIDGVTDQFDPERAEVQAACDNARKALAKAEVAVDPPNANNPASNRRVKP
jgi:hypothetical protein